MKRILITVIILAITTITGVVLWKNINHTGSIGLKDFAIEKPEKITRIFFASNDSKLGWLQLDKEKDGVWWVKTETKKYKADTASVHDLLNYVMANLQVKNPVNDAALESVNRAMALHAVKAQFYSGSELVKTVYAGGPTYDQLATYMYLPGEANSKKHDRPCVVIVPGHNGFVTPYFNVDINSWRSPAIIDIPSKDIANLKITWNEEQEEGFEIRKNEESYELLNYKGAMVNANQNRLIAFVDMFSWITREGGEIAGINNNKEAKKALLASNPFFIIDIQDKNAKHIVLKVYHRPVSEETYAPVARTGKINVHETESYWGVLEGTDEIWVLQDGILKNRMRKLSDFTRK
jgi:hypothetical protein